MFLLVLKRFLYQKMIDIFVAFPKWLFKRLALHTLRGPSYDSFNIDSFNIMTEVVILIAVYFLNCAHLLTYGFILYPLITSLVTGAIGLGFISWKWIMPWLNQNWEDAKCHVIESELKNKK